MSRVAILIQASYFPKVPTTLHRDPALAPYRQSDTFDLRRSGLRPRSEATFVSPPLDCRPPSPWEGVHAPSPSGRGFTLPLPLGEGWGEGSKDLKGLAEPRYYLSAWKNAPPRLVPPRPPRPRLPPRVSAGARSARGRDGPIRPAPTGARRAERESQSHSDFHPTARALPRQPDNRGRGAARRHSPPG